MAKQVSRGAHLAAFKSDFIKARLRCHQTDESPPQRAGLSLAAIGAAVRANNSLSWVVEVTSSEGMAGVVWLK
jgi:hypothetical protein